MKYFLGCIITLLSLTVKATLHPVHVSFANIEYSKKTSELLLSFKINTEDFELAIAHNYNIALNFGRPNESPDAVKHINRYFSNAFSLLINNKLKPGLIFVSKEVTDDGTWFHFSIPGQKHIRELKISNTLLMDIFEDQVNLLIISINGKEHGLRFTFGHFEEKLKI